eukprot:1026661-Prorocentrum_minimum.AAC.2
MLSMFRPAPQGWRALRHAAVPVTSPPRRTSRGGSVLPSYRPRHVSSPQNEQGRRRSELETREQALEREIAERIEREAAAAADKARRLDTQRRFAKEQRQRRKLKEQIAQRRQKLVALGGDRRKRLGRTVSIPAAAPSLLDGPRPPPSGYHRRGGGGGGGGGGRAGGRSTKSEEGGYHTAMRALALRTSADPEETAAVGDSIRQRVEEILQVRHVSWDGFDAGRGSVIRTRPSGDERDVQESTRFFRVYMILQILHDSTRFYAILHDFTRFYMILRDST